jgi:flavodoxin I
MLILGIPTWHVGEVQDDWALLLPKLEHLNFTGKKIALFGLGDANGYPDTFADALAEVWTCFRQAGAQLVGTWPTTDYTFTASRSLIEPDRFLGLVLDEDNEPGQTPERLQAWVQQLRHELAL